MRVAAADAVRAIETAGTKAETGIGTDGAPAGTRAAAGAAAEAGAKAERGTAANTGEGAAAK